MQALTPDATLTLESTGNDRENGQDAENAFMLRAAVRSWRHRKVCTQNYGKDEKRLSRIAASIL